MIIFTTNNYSRIHKLSVANQIINLNSLKNTDLLARLVAKNLFPKAIVLLWGEMGSGKTTFAKLLLRFYDPIKGQIKIGEHVLSDISISDIRRNIGFLSQEIFLFDGTIRDNIVYSKIIEWPWAPHFTQALHHGRSMRQAGGGWGHPAIA